MTYPIETIASGLCFTESPRWHQNSLWFSDFYSETVYRLDQQNQLHTELILPGRPSGLGWDKQGNLLVVNMLERALYRYDGNSAIKVADISALAGGNCNDMIVSKDGHAYIGNFGSEVTSADFQPAPAILARVAPDGSVHIAAEDLLFANGMAIIDDGKTLIVAESKAYCLTAFDIAADGSLSNRRVWAECGNYEPDGICADGKGGIWVTTMQPCVIRLEEGGHVSHNIATEQRTMACEIGGENDEYLYLCTTAHMNPQQCMDNKSSRIERIDISRLN
jgi:sugar lactone lactonase YvrE